ncbi:MAG: FixH family protein [Dongiaceae bacterium]
MRRSLPARAAEPGGGRRGLWIPGVFVAGFVVMLAVNAALVYLALDSFSGLETEGAYRRGVAYDATLAAARAQGEMGWRVAIDATPLPAADGGPGRARDLAATFADRAGWPLGDLSVRALLIRPTHAGYDLEVALPHLGAGRYGAQVLLPLPGQWELRLVAARGAETWQTSRRLHLP